MSECGTSNRLCIVFAVCGVIAVRCEKDSCIEFGFIATGKRIYCNIPAALHVPMP